MKIYSKAIVILFFSILLTGCGDLKEAVSGISSAADTAASATSTDVHAIRSIKLVSNGQNFTVNELFKGLLKDVKWQYEEVAGESLLHVKGTWKEPLFSSYSFDSELKDKLVEDGDVLVTLTVGNDAIISENSSIQLIYQNEILVEESGTQVLNYLLETYTSKK